MEEQKEVPYRGLGKRLKVLRTRAKESLAEASGAVEIDVKQLADYELGQDRPSEDVLLLLISHFDAGDDEAIKLWELAGYGTQKNSASHQAGDNKDASQPKILFTDIVDVTVNNYGVVMNFMQGAGSGAKAESIARVGMSREHAKSVLQILQITLAQTENNLKSLSNKMTNSETSPETKTP
ncbi:MAG TPA: helix-turn-helix transcriptional regulator [Candidatus Saccharimonadales bacterium]|nr:helix-turn-helix transcriptional regulator [Candidatus Saccharimonadales bacterium]